MPRPATGAVIEHQGRDGRTYRGLRFTAYGKRRFLSLGPVTRDHAERELRHVLADVERGTWEPAEPVAPPPEAEPVPTFHEYAERWWVLHDAGFAAKTRTDYRWRLERHLLPHFAAEPLDRITFDSVERYIAAKLAEPEPLCASSINKTVILLASILESAVERDLIARNPAKGKDRRVRERAPQRTYLDTAEQIDALLRAAGDLDALALDHHRHVERRAILAVFMFAGLRIGELCALRWRDVDLATGWLRIQDAKTDAGVRSVKLRGALRDELAAVKARTRHAAPGDYVFATRTGGRSSVDNVRARVVNPAVKRASELLIADGSAPLPGWTSDDDERAGGKGITPHSLRRTFASILYAIGENPGVVMDEMGHTDEGLALRVYRQAMRRDAGETARLRVLIEGDEMADIGRRAADTSEVVGLRDAA